MHSLFISVVVIGLFVAGLSIAVAEFSDPRCEQRPNHSQCQTSTTTTISTTTTTGFPDGVPSIGVVGCSNTEDAVENPGGYLTQSDQDLLATSASGGGALAFWANPIRTRYWDIYDAKRPSVGYESVWWQLCVRTDEGEGSYEDQMDYVLTQIRDRDPGVPVLVSWLNHYTFDACPQVDWGAEDQLLDYAATLGLLAGPWLGPLDPTQVREDNCHPNSDGWGLLGSQLVDFFD